MSLRVSSGRQRLCGGFAFLALAATWLVLGACGQSTDSGGGSSNTGTLTGDVVAGPTRPLARPGTPTPTVAVTNRSVTIETVSGATVATSTTDDHGHFSVILAPGTYVVRVTVGPGTVGIRQNTPGTVTVVAGQITSITIELDTGLR